jgi:hypothetical protein
MTIDAQTVADSAEEPELEANPPAGVTLEYLTTGGVRVQVQVAPLSRLLLAVPRIMLVLAVVLLVVESWRHHLFAAFWFFGLPFLRWLRGAKHSSLLIGERSLEVAGANWFGGTRSLPRVGIESITVGHAGLLRLYRPALVVRDRDQQETLIFAGISAAQAAFVNGGLQRWLAGVG